MKVISASRRIEMVGGFPEKLAEILRDHHPPESVHTLVLWTKDPQNIWKNNQLNAILKEYRQIYVHFTITGFGKTKLEPYIPSCRQALQLIPRLIEFVKSPERVMIRFDPIIHLKLGNSAEYSNLERFPEIAHAISSCGIRHVTVSWMEPYAKVVNRLKKHEILWVSINQETWQNDLKFLTDVSKPLGIEIHGCCVPGLPMSRCIDGELLSALHPDGAIASSKKAKAQRKLCGCTESLDIGWYYPCPSGCLYCYANPQTRG